MDEEGTLVGNGAELVASKAGDAIYEACVIVPFQYDFALLGLCVCVFVYVYLLDRT